MSYAYNWGAKSILDRSLNLNLVKAILVRGDYTPNRDHRFVSQLNAAGTPGTATSEITATQGYVRGFGASGRQSLAGVTFTVSDALDRAIFDGNDLSWIAVITSDAITRLVLALEVTSDADSILLAQFDGTGYPMPALSGQDALHRWSVDGIIYLPTA